MSYIIEDIYCTTTATFVSATSRKKYLRLNHDFFFFYRIELLKVQTQQNILDPLNMQSNIAIKCFNQSFSTTVNAFERFMGCHKRTLSFTVDFYMKTLYES